MPALRRNLRPFREPRDPERWRLIEARFFREQTKNRVPSTVSVTWSYLMGFIESVLSSNGLTREVGPDHRPLERFEFEDPSARRSCFGPGSYLN